MSDILDELAPPIWREAWEFLDLEDPTLADAVKRAVAAGKQPDEIRSRYLRTAGDSRSAKARRVENAAKHLWSLKTI